MSETKWEVCPRCEGEGKHVNPAIDGNGLSSEDFDELGDEFREDYFAGIYDVPCYECKGKRVVKAQSAKTQDELENEAFDREWAAEMRRESMMLGEF